MVAGLKSGEETTMHALGGSFLHDLKDGILAPLTDAVLSDSTLCLELRGDYINVYYRGGSLMKIKKSGDTYKVRFDKKYFKNDPQVIELGPGEIAGEANTGEWIACFPKLRQAMDRYFGRLQKDEREFQQLLVRENNFGASRGPRIISFAILSTSRDPPGSMPLPCTGRRSRLCAKMRTNDDWFSSK